MGINSLEKPAHNPKVHCQNMKVPSDGTPQYRGSNRAETEDHDFDGRSVLGSHTKRGRVLMVNLVDVFVERTPVQSAMGPIMPCVLYDKEDGDLVGHREKRRKGDASRKAKVLGHRVEEP